jgi:hypothetical protein
MDAMPSTYLLLANEVRGPYSSDQLQVLAEVGAVTPDTGASARPDGPWLPLRQRPDAAQIFPARREFQFKAPEFERLNRAPGPPADHREGIAAAQGGPAEPPRPPPNDVLEIVRATTRIQAQFEKSVDLTPRPNRRLRDYLLAMALVNGFFGAAILFGHGSPATLIYGLSGIVIASSGITWVMFGVMDRY